MKKFFAVIMLAAIVMLCGCNQETTTSNSGKGSIDPAVFCLEDSRFPRISLKEDMTFGITFNSMATGSVYGTYSVSPEEILTLTTDSGSVYNFEIKKTSIVFDADTSDDFVSDSDEEFSAETTPEIVDGAKFEIWRKR
jgi:ABC-type oligopeptide transport system substrate-binding subunit